MPVLIDATEKPATTHRYVYLNKDTGTFEEKLDLKGGECLCEFVINPLGLTSCFGRCCKYEEYCDDVQQDIRRRMNAFQGIRSAFMMAIHTYMKKNGTESNVGKAFAFATYNQAVSFTDETKFPAMFMGLGMRDVASMVADVAYDVEGKEEEELMHMDYYCIERDSVDDASLTSVKKAFDEAGLKICSWEEAGYISPQ